MCCVIVQKQARDVHALIERAEHVQQVQRLVESFDNVSFTPSMLLQYRDKVSVFI